MGGEVPHTSQHLRCQRPIGHDLDMLQSQTIQDHANIGQLKPSDACHLRGLYSSRGQSIKIYTIYVEAEFSLLKSTRSM